jgi:hypothetical protein
MSVSSELVSVPTVIASILLAASTAFVVMDTDSHQTETLALTLMSVVNDLVFVAMEHVAIQWVLTGARATKASL